MTMKQGRLRDPSHLIVGFNLIVTGLILLFHRAYFFWPPFPRWITTVENDSIVGFVGVMTGLAMIWYACQTQTDKSIRLNRICLATASAYFMFLCMTELMHGWLAPQGEPHMLTAAAGEFSLLLFTLRMAKKSPIKKIGGKSN